MSQASFPQQDASIGGWKVTQPIEWKTITAATKSVDTKRFWCQPYSSVYLHDSGKWTWTSTTVDPAIINDIAAIYLHMDSCYSATEGLTEKHYSEGSYLWKVYQKQSYKLFQDRERQSTLNSNTLIPEMKTLVNEHRTGVPLCTGAREGRLNASTLAPPLPETAFTLPQPPTPIQPSEGDTSRFKRPFSNGEFPFHMPTVTGL